MLHTMCVFRYVYDGPLHQGRHVVYDQGHRMDTCQKQDSDQNALRSRFLRCTVVYSYILITDRACSHCTCNEV